MSRYMRNIRKRRTRKIIIYIVSCFILMILFIIIVDYRTNNVFGNGTIRIVSFDKTYDYIGINLFDKKIGTINVSFLRKDVNIFIDSASSFVNNGIKLLKEKLF